MMESPRGITLTPPLDSARAGETPSKAVAISRALTAALRTGQRVVRFRNSMDVVVLSWRVRPPPQEPEAIPVRR